MTTVICAVLVTFTGKFEIKTLEGRVIAATEAGFVVDFERSARLTEVRNPEIYKSYRVNQDDCEIVPEE